MVYGFLRQPRWIAFHVLVLGAIVVMLNLGLWQLRRLDERQAFNAIVEARYDAAPEPLDALVPAGIDVSSVSDDLNTDDLSAVEWRPVTASGTYLPEERFTVVNRSQYGRPGVNVVVPLRLDDGRLLVVNRGFVPLAAEIPPIPADEVSILGRLRPSEERRFGQLADPAEGELSDVQRIDLERLAPQLPGKVVPMFVDLIASDPPEPQALPEPVIAPDLSEGNHLSYAVQWFVFSAAVAVGWFLAVAASAKRRQRRTTQHTDEPAGSTTHQPAPS